MGLGMSADANQEGSCEPYPEDVEGRHLEGNAESQKCFNDSGGSDQIYLLTIPRCPGITYLTHYALSCMV